MKPPAIDLQTEHPGAEYDHVFIVHTHTNAPQVSRLIHILRQTCRKAFILISHDKTAPPLPVDFSHVPDSIVIAGSGGRGDCSIVDGYIAALRWLEREGIRYRWISNLSSQDYPSRSMRDFLETCNSASDTHGFIHHFDAFQIDKDAMAPWTWQAREGLDRYHFRYRKLSGDMSWKARAAVWPFRRLFDMTNARWRINPSYGLMLGTYRGSTPFNPAFRCFAGSYWHTISAFASHYLLQFLEERPEVLEYFRHTLIPDESFVQTVLANAPGLHLKNDNLRLIDMTRSRHGRPKVFDESDLPEIVSSGKFFVRKVTLESTSMLEKLDEYAAS